MLKSCGGCGFRWSKFGSAASALLAFMAAALLTSVAYSQSNPFPDADYRGSETWGPLLGSPTPVVFDPLVVIATPAAPARLFPGFPLSDADDVIRYNACGRELDYAMIRTEMADASNAHRYAHEGSELITILNAKIAWLNNQATASLPCVASATYLSGPTTVVQLFQNAIGASPGPSDCVQVAQGPGQYAASGGQLIANTVIFTVAATRPGCMREQVNQAIMAMSKVGNLGSSNLLCGAGHTTTGEWDQNNRELVRLLYLGTEAMQPATQFAHEPVLDPATVSYMESSGLLAAVGPPGPDTYPAFLDSCSGYAGDQKGGPQDIEDQGDFGNTLERDLGNGLKWALAWLLKLFASSVIGGATGGTPLALLPLLVDVEDDPFASLAPGIRVPIPETENHRIQIESARFLTNRFYIQSQIQNGGDYGTLQDDQNEVASWLQDKFQSVANSDFLEYNAKDYATYTQQSLLNLFDFSEDEADMRTAAHVLLNLSDAKFAAGSNLGRRLAPFRRHTYEDGYAINENAPCAAPTLYQTACSEDQGVLRAMALAMQTRLLPSDPANQGTACRAPSICFPRSALPGLLNDVTSQYTLPDFLLDIEVHRPGSFDQSIRHAGIEYYHQETSFTATAGGIPTDSPYKVLGFNGDPSSQGDAMPASIIPTMEGTGVTDVFSFNGIGVGKNRNANLCLWRGFICGVNPNAVNPGNHSAVPGFFNSLSNCPGAVEQYSATIWFVNSYLCQGGAGNAFFLAQRIEACDGRFCDTGSFYGFMEVIDAPDHGLGVDAAAMAAAYGAFKSTQSARLQSVNIDAQGIGSYTNSAGEVIHFQVSRTEPQILDVGGTPRPAFATAGGIIDSDGSGKITIHSPFSTAHIDIDYSSAQNPTWSPSP